MAIALTDNSGAGTAGMRRWFPFFVIIAASALAHVWCLGSQFYLDDPTGIRDNEAIHAGMFWGRVSGVWTDLGYVIQYKLFGKSPVGFHAVNWLLHTAVACVLFGFGRDFMRGRAPAGHAHQVKDKFLQTPTSGQIKERRNASADAHGKPMCRASALPIASSWTSANTFRRSLGHESGPCALNLTRMPAGAALFGAVLFAVHPLASEIPNYARTQDLAWVTLFSLLASWALLSFLLDGGSWKPVWVLLGIAGATMSKGPGVFHALMMTGTVGLAFMTPAHWSLLRRRWWWLAGVFLLGFAALWFSGYLPRLLGATIRWAEPRIIGHGYTVARVFWEFAWRAVVPVSLSSDHHITETLMPPGASFWNIPDTGAMWAAAAMLALTALSIFLAWRKPTRLLGVCLFLFTATMLFRVLYLVPEFMPEYRIYPGMPWFCLGAAIGLAALWNRFLSGFSPRFPAVVLILVFALISAKRSFLWHDLDRLMADVLKQYPGQARAIWELHRRDAYLGDWRKIIDRQRRDWQPVFRRFLEENSRLAPARALPTGHFALADVACAGLYAEALAHMEGHGPAMLELLRLEAHMRGLRMDPVEHKIHWNYFYRSKVRVLEQAGQHQAALDLIRKEGEDRFEKADIRRIRKKLGEGP